MKVVWGLAMLLMATAALAQLDPKDPASYFDAMPVHSNDQQIRLLLEEAREECTEIEALCKPGEDLLRLLFQGSYRDNLPDFIVQLERNESGQLIAHQPLLIFNRRNTPYLLGAQHLWVLVVSDEELPMEARITTLEETDVNPFAGVIGLLGVSAGDSVQTASSSAETGTISWRRLASEGAEAGTREPLFLGSARLPVKGDTICRLTLLPTGGEELGFQSITGHISNSFSSGVAFSIGLGATLDTEGTEVEESGDPYINGYALAKFYFPGKRPRLQVAPDAGARYKRSMGVVIGTNVTDDPFSEIVIGLSFGHLIGKAGLFVAGNAVRDLETDDREFKLLVGVDFTF